MTRTLLLRFHSNGPLLLLLLLLLHIVHRNQFDGLWCQSSGSNRWFLPLHTLVYILLLDCIVLDIQYVLRWLNGRKKWGCYMYLWIGALACVSVFSRSSLGSLQNNIKEFSQASLVWDFHPLKITTSQRSPLPRWVIWFFHFSLLSLFSVYFNALFLFVPFVPNDRWLFVLAIWHSFRSSSNRSFHQYPGFLRSFIVCSDIATSQTAISFRMKKFATFAAVPPCTAMSRIVSVTTNQKEHGRWSIETQAEGAQATT